MKSRSALWGRGPHTPETQLENSWGSREQRAKINWSIDKLSTVSTWVFKILVAFQNLFFYFPSCLVPQNAQHIMDRLGNHSILRGPLDYQVSQHIQSPSHTNRINRCIQGWIHDPSQVTRAARIGSKLVFLFSRLRAKWWGWGAVLWWGGFSGGTSGKNLPP